MSSRTATVHSCLASALAWCRKVLGSGTYELQRVHKRQGRPGQGRCVQCSAGFGAGPIAKRSREPSADSAVRNQLGFDRCLKAASYTETPRLLTLQFCASQTAPGLGEQERWLTCRAPTTD